MRFERTDSFFDLTVPGLHNYVCEGLIHHNSNRAGKTVCAAIEVARCATNQDPHRKYPQSGDIYIVGRDLKHLALTLYPKLFKSGDGVPFRMIRDRRTKLWRSYRPWDADDRARKHETKSAPPLIPPRLVEKTVWFNKGAGEVEKVVLKNGWTIWFFSGKGDPPCGSVADLVLFDEEITSRAWYSEMNARIADRHGCIVWSFTPQAATPQAYELGQVAQADACLPPHERLVEEFVIKLANNPHIDDKAKADMAASCTSEEDRLVRIEGEYALAGQVVFPEFSLTRHGLDLPGCKVPETWTRYAVVDPGRQICAVLFAAVPDPADVPPELYDLVLYDELYVANCSAMKFGREMALKCEGQRFEAFVIDKRGSQHHEAGSGLTVVDQYAAALRENGVSSRTTGHGFAFGVDMPKAGVEMARGYLLPRDNGHPRLRVLCDRDPDGHRFCRLKNFEWEVARYRKKRDSLTGLVTDELEDRGRVHLMATFRYLVMHRPKFVRPEARVTPQAQRLLDWYADWKKPVYGDGPRAVTYFGPAGRRA